MSMKSNQFLTAVLLTGILAPFVAGAQFLTDTGMIIASFGGIINMSIGILTAIALLMFVWGIVKYISAAGDAKKAAEGKSIMIYGVVALFVLFSVWGLVDFIGREFGIPANNNLNQYAVPPRINF